MIDRVEQRLGKTGDIHSRFQTSTPKTTFKREFSTPRVGNDPKYNTFYFVQRKDTMPKIKNLQSFMPILKRNKSTDKHLIDFSPEKTLYKSMTVKMGDDILKPRFIHQEEMENSGFKEYVAYTGQTIQF
jgi:hypothetical protein